MKFEIQNYRKVKSATIEIADRLTFIAGKNGAGKTSVIDAMKCALTGNPNPFNDILKKQSSMLVHSGTPCGSIKMIDGENELTIDYPEQKINITGAVESISDCVSGVSSILDMNPKERIKYISEVMGATPNEIDLISAIKKSEIFPKSSTIGSLKPFQELWESIKRNGWDNAYEKIKELGAELKGLWKHYTGKESYGKNIADSWYPENWETDLEKETEKKLEEKYSIAKEKYVSSEKSVILDKMERERLEVLVSLSDEYNTKKIEFSEKHKKLESERIELLNTDRSEVRGLLCPCCQSKLTLTNGELKRIPDNEPLSDNKEQLDRIKKEQNELLMQFGELRKVLEEIENAKTTLSNVSENKDFDKMKNEYVIAEKRLNAFRQYNIVKTVNQKIINNKKAQDILSPLGLRSEILKKKIDIINNSAKMLSGYAEWDTVEISVDGNITYNGIPYGRLIAKSERYRTRILLQYMIAMAEKATMVVIDDVDELTGDTRNGLIRLILSTKIKAIISCALKNKSELPDLKKYGGLSYWIENGVV